MTFANSAITCIPLDDTLEGPPVDTCRIDQACAGRSRSAGPDFLRTRAQTRHETPGPDPSRPRPEGSAAARARARASRPGTRTGLEPCSTPCSDYSRCATDILEAWFISALRIKLTATLLWRSSVTATTGKASTSTGIRGSDGDFSWPSNLIPSSDFWPEARACIGAFVPRGNPTTVGRSSLSQEDDLVPSKERERGASAGWF